MSLCGEENGTPLDTGKSERRVKASQSSWIEMLGREERAYKVRFQVGALIQDLCRLLRRNNVAGVVLFSLEVVV